MKIRLLIATLLVALTPVLGLRAQEAKKDQTELGAHMDKMSGAMRTLNRQVDDATKNQDSLAQIAIIRDNINAALKLKPAKTAEIPADQQAKFVADYQAKLKATLSDVEKVEAALKAGNNAEAKTLLGTLKQDQTEGHKAFKAAAKKN